MNNKINLLIVNPSLYIGGAEIVIKNLCYHLDSSKFNVSLFCLKNIGSIGEELLESGFDVQCSPQTGNDRTDYFTSINLLKACKNKNIHLIHSHATHSLVDACLAHFLHLTGRSKPPVVHTFHCGEYPLPQKKRDLLERVFWRFTDKLVAVGNFQKKQLQKTYHIPDTRIETIWNGVSPIQGKIDFDFTGIRHKCQGTIIGTIGTLFKQKGITHLLDTAYLLKKRNQDVTFLIAGEGPLRQELEEKRNSLGLEDSVHFLGWIQNASISLLPHVDIFFQPSLWEAMSVVILEAMMLGKPIVATKVGENKYIIEHEMDGLIVEPARAEDMAAALEKLISNRDLRDKFGKAARKKYEKSFSADVMAKRYDQLYTEVLTENLS